MVNGKFITMIIFLLILLAISILLEGTLLTLPLTLVCLICLTIFKRDTSVFAIAFIAGIFLDIFHVQPIGGTSIFFVCALFLILLYKKKYEIYSIPFVMLSTLFGSFLYLTIFKDSGAVLLSFVSAVVAVILFCGIAFFAKFQTKSHSEFLQV